MQTSFLKWTWLLIFSSFSLLGFSQMKITGTVVDATGEGMPGVNITIKGKTVGTISSIDGKFALSVPARTDVLVVSFIGYKNQELKVGNQKSFYIVMEEASHSLNEVIVSAGYTEVKRRDFTGASGKANLDDMMQTPIVSFDQALAGRVAGVQVASNEGMPGSAFNIVIRGNNSLTQDNSPLYVIDGFPVEDANAAAINPADIESLDVLKDAAATAIYGARGANGVIIITTKRGVAGKPTVTYSGSYSVQKLTNKLELMDGYEFVRLQQEMRTADEMKRTWFSPITVDGVEIQRDLEYWRTAPAYDWQEEIFHLAHMQNHHASVMGGKDGTRYTASLSYTDQKGIIHNSGFKRYQGRVSLEQKLGSKFKLNLNANYSRSITNGTSPSGTTSAVSNTLMYSVWGYRPVRWDDTDLKEELFDPVVDTANDYRFNPFLSSREEYKKGTGDDLAANTSLEYSIIKGLKAKVSAGFRSRKGLNEQFNNSKTRYGNSNRSEGVNASMGTSEKRAWVNENTLTYSTKIKKKHNLTVLGGVTFQGDYYKSYSMKVNQIVNEDLGMSGLDEGTPSTVGSSLSESKLMSYLGRLTYNYDSKYYLTGTFRADGSSKFPSGSRWGYFPSLSAAWNFNREAFLESTSNWLSNGKIRVSWGTTGNNRVSDFASYSQMYSNIDSEYSFGNTYAPGYVFNALGNPGLKWETTEQINLGLDLGFFDDRINLVVDIYRKRTKDLLLRADLPNTTGFSTAYKNVGKMQNRGLEITLETWNVKGRNFTWSTNFNIAFNQGKILELNEGQEALLSTVSFNTTRPVYIAQVGKPMGLIYGHVYDGTYKYDDFNKDSSGKYVLKPTVVNNGGERSAIKPGTAKYKDINHDGVVNDDDRTVIGRGHPIHTGGFTNNFKYKNFDLSVFFQWSYGNDILNANRNTFENGEPKKDTNMFASYANRWTPDNPDSDIPAVRGQGPAVMSSRIVEDGSYLRLKTVSFGYNVPKTFLSKCSLSSARIYVSGENLWTWTSYSGYDPEVSVRHSALTPGYDYSAYPRARTFSIGLKIGF